MADEKASRSGTLLAYASMLAIAGIAFWLLESRGELLVAPAPAPFAPRFEGGSEKSDPHVLMHVLLALAVVIVAARAVGALFKRLQQPAVIGEVIAGIVLGPSVLGAVWPQATGYLMPPPVAPFLGIIAQVGVVLSCSWSASSSTRVTGMRPMIGLVSGREHWLMVGVIILAATIGKLGGSFAAAALGVLMNTRGLMELIVLNVGLDLRVISPALFAMMVIMAVVSTFATSPILSLIMPSACVAPEALACPKQAV